MDLLTAHVGRTPQQEERYPTTVDYNNHLPSRLQWDQNFGYCGEVSMISAGMYYGQYCSQYTARFLSNSPPISQCNPESQLLLGPSGNSDAEVAAAAMSLNGTTLAMSPNGGSGYTVGSSKDFLVWVKQQVALGYPVIIGVYLNYSSIPASTDPGCGNYGFAVTGVMDNSTGGPFVQRVQVTTLDGTGQPTTAP